MIISLFLLNLFLVTFELVQIGYQLLNSYFTPLKHILLYHLGLEFLSDTYH